MLARNATGSSRRNRVRRSTSAVLVAASSRFAFALPARCGAGVFAVLTVCRLSERYRLLPTPLLRRTIFSRGDDGSLIAPPPTAYDLNQPRTHHPSAQTVRWCPLCKTSAVVHRANCWCKLHQHRRFAWLLAEHQSQGSQGARPLFGREICNKLI